MYKLNKEVKKGSIKSRNKKLDDVMTIVTAGLAISLSISAVHTVYARNLSCNKNYKIEETYLNSTSIDDFKDLENILGVTFDKEYVDDAYSLCSNLRTIDDFNRGGSFTKIDISNELVDKKDSICDKAFYILRSKIAEEHGVSQNDVKFNSDYCEPFYTIDGEKFKLDSEEKVLHDAIFNLRDYKEQYITEYYNTDNAILLNNSIKDVVLDTVKYIDNQDDMGYSNCK